MHAKKVPYPTFISSVHRFPFHTEATSYTEVREEGCTTMAIFEHPSNWARHYYMYSRLGIAIKAAISVDVLLQSMIVLCGSY